MNPTNGGPMLRRILSRRGRVTGGEVPGTVTIPAPVDARFLLVHCWLPLAAFAALTSALALAHGDAWLAGQLYAWEGHRWALKSSFVTENLIHIAGRNLSIVAWVCVFAMWIAARTRTSLAYWRKPLGYLLIATLLSTLLVTWVKSFSNMDCPWDLLPYGGDHPYVGLFSPRPAGLPHGACFPAGHASGGYSWMALYFFFLASRPSLRWLGLSVSVAIGLVFGISQQLRGAHFLSHDVWTAMICWMSALAVYVVFWRRSQAAVAADEEIAATVDAHGTAST